MKNVEIFKECEDGKLTMEEVDLILIVSGKSFKFYNDRANGYIAFALDETRCDRTDADILVNILNELCERMHNEPNWFLGDEGEEYVFVN